MHWFQNLESRTVYHLCVLEPHVNMYRNINPLVQNSNFDIDEALLLSSIEACCAFLQRTVTFSTQWHGYEENITSAR